MTAFGASLHIYWMASWSPVEQTACYLKSTKETSKNCIKRQIGASDAFMLAQAPMEPLDLNKTT